MAVRAAMQGLLDTHSEGTDLDLEYGASMAGVSEAVQEVIWQEIEQKYGKKFTKIAKEIFRLIDFDTAEKDDLKALSAILESGTIKGIRREDFEKMSGEEINAIIVHAKEMTVPGEGFNTKALKEAANAVAKGGIPALRKYEKTLGWNVEE